MRKSNQNLNAAFAEQSTNPATAAENEADEAAADAEWDAEQEKEDFFLAHVDNKAFWDEFHRIAPRPGTADLSALKREVLKEAQDNLGDRSPKRVRILSPPPLSETPTFQLVGPSNARKRKNVDEENDEEARPTKRIQDMDKYSPLPVGWEKRFIETSKVYFVIHNTEKTTFDDPRLGRMLGQDVPHIDSSIADTQPTWNWDSVTPTASVPTSLSTAATNMYERGNEEANTMPTWYSARLVELVDSLNPPATTAEFGPLVGGSSFQGPLNALPAIGSYGHDRSDQASSPEPSCRRERFSDDPAPFTEFPPSIGGFSTVNSLKRMRGTDDLLPDKRSESGEENDEKYGTDKKQKNDESSEANGAVDDEKQEGFTFGFEREGNEMEDDDNWDRCREDPLRDGVFQVPEDDLDEELAAHAIEEKLINELHEVDEEEDLLKGVTLPKTMKVRGLSLKKLELNGVGAIGQRLLWIIIDLFPGLTTLSLHTAQKGAARRWILGCWEEAFRNCRHLRKLHHLDTNYSTYIPLSSVPADMEHRPQPDKPTVAPKIAPKASTKSKNWKDQIRELPRTRLFLDRFPAQFTRLDMARICRDQWLVARKAVLREFGKSFAAVEDGGTGWALEMNHLQTVKFIMGEMAKSEMVVAINRTSDLCPNYVNLENYMRKDIKMTCDIPRELLFLGLRTRQICKKAEETEKATIAAENEAEADDLKALDLHSGRGRCDWFTGQLRLEPKSQPFNHLNLTKIGKDYPFRAKDCVRDIDWDWW
ncbi:MAG: hypothetical protein M1827_005007 [Pycnora praestabilis]|nr:MAG: hypothetical protein M1827_005007 [Pycnora praestabilis]